MTSSVSTSEDSSGLTRAQLYERIRTSSKQEVVLEEMQRLGFWPADAAQPTVEETLIRREAELSQALRDLGQELHHIQDPVAALKTMRKERMARARQRREEIKQKRAQERFAKAASWNERRQRELFYLGAGVSAGLNQVHSDSQKLQRLDLPALHTAQELAGAMGIGLSELRFLAFERRVSRISHYRRFAVAKKTGGERIISAPMPRLKRAQYWVLDNLLKKVPLHAAAHGFVNGRSIVSNALPHVGQAVVVNLDLKDFFPSIGLPRIKGVFRQLGYSEQLASTLALLCTESRTDEVEVDGEKFFVGRHLRVLPQGAPTSPALTNILCRRMDARLQACAAKLGFRYTRYADDLTFSTDASAARDVGKLLWRAKQIVIDEGFTPHPEKEHVMRYMSQQQVTGIVVNSKPSLDRDTVRRFRAVLFQVEKDGPQGKQWNGNSNVLEALEGYARFISMVDAARGAPYLQRLHVLRSQHTAATVTGSAGEGKRRSAFRQLSGQGKAPWAGWWQPQLSTVPVLEKTAEQIAQEKKSLKAEAKVAATISASTPQQARTQQVTESQTTQSFVEPANPNRPSVPVPYAILLAQFGLALIVAIEKGSFLLFACATLFLVSGIKSRRVSWLPYLIVLGLSFLSNYHG